MTKVRIKDGEMGIVQEAKAAWIGRRNEGDLEVKELKNIPNSLYEIFSCWMTT